MSNKCNCGFDHWPLPCKSENPPNERAESSFAAPTLLERCIERMDKMRTEISRADPALKQEYMRGAHYATAMCIGIVREETYRAKVRSND